jgi:hypothetical protein
MRSLFPRRRSLTTRALALVDRDVSSLEETNESRPITAPALDRERRHAELLSPTEQAAVAGKCCGDLLAVELGAESVESDRNVDLLVCVDADCHRPLHDQPPSRRGGRPAWTGLCRAKDARFYQVTGQPKRSGGGRQVADPRQDLRQHGCGSSCRRLALSAAHRTETARRRRCTAWLSQMHDAEVLRSPARTSGGGGTATNETRGGGTIHAVQRESRGSGTPWPRPGERTREPAVDSR